VSGLGMNAGEADFTPRFSDRSHLPSTLPEFPERSFYAWPSRAVPITLQLESQRSSWRLAVEYVGQSCGAGSSSIGLELLL